MKKFKTFAKTALYYIKLFDILRMIQKKRVVILMYHRFSDKSEPFKIQESVFENQIKFLRKKRYNFISLKHYSDYLSGKSDFLPDHPVVVTIDDGYQDNYFFAYPVLKRYDIPATIFLTTDFVTQKTWLWSNKLEYILKTTNQKTFTFSIDGQETLFNVEGFKNWHNTQLSIYNYCRKLLNSEKENLLERLASELNVKVPDQTTDPFLSLTWEQVREMYKGGIRFGSHTCSHPICSRLTINELRHELIHSKTVIEEKISAPVNDFCYPNGQPEDYSGEVLAALKDAKYLTAVTTTPGFNGISGFGQNPYLLKRISILTSDKKVMTVRMIRG